MGSRAYFETFNLLNRIELETGIGEAKLRGVYFWRLVRFGLHRRLMDGVLKGYDGESGLGPKVGRAGMGFYSAVKGLVFSPLLKSEKRVNLILEHPRKIKVGNKYVDPYTSFLIGSFRKARESYRSLEKPVFGNLAPLGASRLQYMGIDFKIFKFWQRVQRKFRRKDEALPGPVLGKIRSVEKAIKDVTDVELNLTKYVDYAISSFKEVYAYFKAYLQKVRPKRLFVVVSYGLYAEIQAAKDLGIEVIEVQHGLVSDLHAGYSFPGWKHVPYMPDRILTFGPAWFEQVKLPGVNFDVVGFPWLNKRIQEFDVQSKKPNLIVVLSQWIVTRELCAWVREMSVLLPDFKFRYKIHPQENPSAAKTALDGCANVEVCTGDLYPFLAEAEWAIGVSSTALFEAIAFDCSIAIAELLSSEQFEEVATKNGVPFCSTPGEMARAVKQRHAQTIDRSRWFQSTPEIMPFA